MGITTENTNKNYTKLSALISSDSFFYSLGDTFNEEIGNYASFELPKDNSIDSWTALFNANGFNDFSLKQIKIAYVEPRFTLIPGELFKSKELETYMENTHPWRPGEKVTSDRLKGLDIRIVYPLNETLDSTLNTYFSNIKSYHVLNPIVSHLNKITLGKLGNMLNVHVIEDYLIITLYNGRKLEFANFFKFKSTEDFLYYVMLVLKQFNLDPEITDVYLSGHFTADAEFYAKLYRYVRNLHYANPAKPISLKKEIAQHQIFDLYGLSTCV